MASPPPSPEVVHRPDPGLARGVWEASPATLYAALALVVAVAAVYLSVRLGLWKRRRGAGRS